MPKMILCGTLISLQAIILITVLIFAIMEYKKTMPTKEEKQKAIAEFRQLMRSFKESNQNKDNAQQMQAQILCLANSIAVSHELFMNNYYKEAKFVLIYDSHNMNLSTIKGRKNKKWCDKMKKRFETKYNMELEPLMVI